MSSPWLALRQAQEAVAAKRPEDAHRALGPLLAEGDRRALKLAREVARAYAARARTALDLHTPEPAWRDLVAAEGLNTGERVVGELRQELSKLAVAQVRGMLEAGRPVDAVAHVVRLRERGVRLPELDRFEAAAQEWVLADELADRGEFLRAQDQADRVAQKLPQPHTGIDRFRAELDSRFARFREALARLHDAGEHKRWREAVSVASEVLAVAPENREAKDVRGRAWAVAVPAAGDLAPPAPHANGASPGGSDVLSAVRASAFGAAAGAGGAMETLSALGRGANPDSNRTQLRPPQPAGPAASAFLSSAGGAQLPRRFLLWVDGVGGYLVCLANRVTFGQATADGPVDVPLFADVSRAHAEVTRDGEGYAIESGRQLRVNGTESKRTVLSAGDRVTLGSNCQFLFHKPVAVSSSARLELTSGHRLPLAVDGVLLMGNELILGPGPDSHIELDVPAPVVIYRSRDGLGVRVPELRFSIDDRPCTDRAALPLPGFLSCEAFAFTVEPVSGRL
jgi:hypothetical protein